MIPEKRKIETADEKTEDLETKKLNNKYISKNVNTPGWYRIADMNTINGAGTSFICSIHTTYNYNDNCSYLLAINSVFNKAKITLLSSLTNTKPISKVRVVKSGEHIYLEVYYNASRANPCYVDFSLTTGNWIKSVNFEPAEENETVLHELTL